MDPIRLVEVKQEVLQRNEVRAEAIRSRLQGEGTFMVNVMGSPGAGKSTLLLQTIQRLGDIGRICVVEADIDSMVDAQRMRDAGVETMQLHTDGACHLDAPTVQAALEALDEAAYDIIFLENIGNLVCPAEFDTGCAYAVELLSVPEGDDKPLKYPLMFTVVDDLLVTKTDVADVFDFDMQRLEQGVRDVNPKAGIYAVSAMTGQGMDDWCDHLAQVYKAWRAQHPKPAGPGTDAATSQQLAEGEAQR